MNNKLKCPRCLIDGREKIIAEILSNNMIAIHRQRSKWGYEEATLIDGDNFRLICGYCRSVVFFRKEESYAESSNKRIVWVHFVSFASGSIAQGIHHGTNNTGTSLLS